MLVGWDEGRNWGGYMAGRGMLGGEDRQEERVGGWEAPCRP
jgi:hypothetical protein